MALVYKGYIYTHITQEVKILLFFTGSYYLSLTFTIILLECYKTDGEINIISLITLTEISY